MQLYVILLLGFIFILYVQADIVLKRNRLPPVNPIETRNGITPIWGTIQQRVDHFNPQDSRNWSMRYISNAQFFEAGGPLFLMIGGEWEIEQEYLMTGQLFDMAKEHNGHLFYIEHRFYGKSFPTADTRVENLIYLSAEQCLADVVYFINFIKNSIYGLRNSKVVAVGGSYAGTLAGWLRLKYPHIVDIAYISSGPMRAVANYREYFDVVRESIGKVSPKCLELLRNSTVELNGLLKSDAGISVVSSLINTCDRVKTEKLHRTYLTTGIIGEVFAIFVQSEGLKGIEETCSKLVKHKGTPFQSVASFIRSIHSSKCIDGYDAYVHKFTSIANEDSLYRSWMYQTCTEFGFFQTAGPPFVPEDDISYRLKMCTDIFGERFGENTLNRGIERTNLIFGGENLKISKAIFVYGSIDPWHRLGIFNYNNPEIVSIMVNGTSHCSDLLSISPSDSAEMVQAKTKVQDLVRQWLKN